MSHSQLIDSLSKYYDTLSALRYIQESDVIRPPQNGHTNVDLEAAREQGFNDDMIKLMQSLPYLSVDCEDTPILPGGTKPRSYLDDDFLDWARDPTFQGIHMTKNTHLVLTNPGKAGIALVYDTESQMLTSWNPSRDVIPIEIKKQSGGKPTPEGLAYANLPSATPEDLLGEWTRNWISLKWLPYRESTGWGFFIEEPTVKELEQASKVAYLREQYQIKLVQRGLRSVYVEAGWNTSAPDATTASQNFDAQLFDRKRLGWKKSSQVLLDKAFQERWNWATIRERLSLPQEVASILDHEPSITPNDLAQSRRLGSGLEIGRPCAHLKL